MEKILIFHPYLAPYRIDLYNHLAKCYNIKVALFGSKAELATLGYDLNYVNQLADFDYKYYSGGFRIGRHLLSWIYFRLIKSFKPDLILSHELGINTLAAILFKKLFGYKIFTTIDDSHVMAMNYSAKREILRKFIVEHIDGAIVVNPLVKSYLETKYSKSTCEFIYFPIIQDDKVLSQKINETKDLANKYITNYDLQNQSLVLFVGRLEKIKNPALLLRAFKRLKESEAKLIIVGSGSQENELHDLAASLGVPDKVIFTGSLTGKDLYAWYYLADLFVLPSQFEPFGAVVNEALVAGCYVIVSDKVGAASLISSSNGSIFESDNEKQLAEEIGKGLKEREKKKHVSGMEHSFSWYFNNLNSYFK